jgi:hypothetical protein
MTSLVLLLLIMLIMSAAASEHVERPVGFGRRTFHNMLIHAVPQHSIFHSTTGLEGLDHDTVAVQEVVLKSPQLEIPEGEFHVCCAAAVRA